MTTETAPQDNATTLLDAPASPSADGADKDKAGSLLDTKPAENGSGEDGQKPPAANDKTTPAPSKDSKPTEPAAVPEKYAEFKAPEGLTLNTKAVESFDAQCKALGLSQENRDKFLAMQMENTQAEVKNTMDAFAKQIQDWAAETKQKLGADPERTLASASKAIDRIFTDPKENQQFRDMMKETGLGNWYPMVRAFMFIGKAISEDKFVEGRPDSKAEKSLAERIFGSPDKT